MLTCMSREGYLCPFGAFWTVQWPLPTRHYLPLLPPMRCLSCVALQGEFNALREQLVRQYHDRAALVFT